MARLNDSGEPLTDQVVCRLTARDGRRLDKIMIAGGYRSRPELVRSLILAILDDDETAHRSTAA